MPTRPAFLTDNRTDWNLASDGISRYGAYLSQKRLAFYRDAADTAVLVRHPQH